jgi:TatD DNase family protein
VHAVRSADAVLDVLDRTGCLANNQVIFHWFSDSSQALTRAIRAGCSFSVNARMLATKRGREYAKAIPKECLLLETDLPPDEEPHFSLDIWEAELQSVAHDLSTLRGEPFERQLLENSLGLIGQGS